MHKSWAEFEKENPLHNKWDKQKITIGIAVDGAAVGAGLSTVINIRMGKPPKILVDNTKDIVDNKVDTIKTASKKLGTKLSNWFK